MANFERDVVVELLKECGGSIPTVADRLGVDRKALWLFIDKDEELSSIYRPRVDPKGGLSSDEELIRKAPPGEVSGQVQAAIAAGGLDEISKDLLSAGHDPQLLARLQTIGGFEKNAGVFLAGSLNLMYKMVVDSGMSLYEHLEFIKKKLKDPNLKDKDRVFWQRAYNTTVDQLGKSYDRVLQGTQVLVKMIPGDSDEKKTKKKPSFAPLK